MDDDLADFVIEKTPQQKKAKRKLFTKSSNLSKSKRPKSDLDDFDLTKGPKIKPPAYLPTGEFTIHSKWISTSLHSNLSKQKIEVIPEKNSKFVADFQLPGGSVVLIIQENEYINQSTKYQPRLVKFYKAHKGRPTIILCVRSKETSEDFAALQDICVLEFGLSLIPVDNLEQIPQVVQQLILTEPNRKKVNPFKFGRNKHTFLDQSLIRALRKLQGIRKKRAKRVYQVFPNLKSVVSASESELAKVLGKAAARGVWHFFHRKTRQ